jgi:hypothetical protein
MGVPHSLHVVMSGDVGKDGSSSGKFPLDEVKWQATGVGLSVADQTDRVSGVTGSADIRLDPVGQLSCRALQCVTPGPGGNHDSGQRRPLQSMPDRLAGSARVDVVTWDSQRYHG